MGKFSTKSRPKAATLAEIDASRRYATDHSKADSANTIWWGTPTEIRA